MKACEGQADAEQQRCVRTCARYDDVCTDRCDDTHDIIVRYCWIKAGLCKASEEGSGFRKTSDQRE